MMKERLTTDDGSTHDVEIRRITIIAHHDQVGDVEPGPRRMILDPETTLYHADRVSPQGLHARTLELVRMVFKQKLPPTATLAYRHVLGLIDLSLKLTEMGVPIMWRYPETYLHPESQAQLADLVIELTEAK